MRYVIKNPETGEYLRGETHWTQKFTTNLDSAKLYHRAADAEAMIEQRRDNTSCVVVPVTVTEAA